MLPTFDRQLVKASHTLPKSARQEFYHIFHHSHRIELENVLDISYILGLLVNSLTANDKYSLRNSENLTQPN